MGRLFTDMTQEEQHPLRLGSSPAFTLIEILVTVSIVVVLAALIFPSVGKLQRTMNRAACVSNLKAISNGISLFLADNNNVYPGNGPSSTSGQSGSKYFRWIHRIGAYMDLSGQVTMRSALGSEPLPTLDTAYTERIFHCPSTQAQLYRGVDPPLESLGVYGCNMNLFKDASDTTFTKGVSATLIRRPAATIVLGDRFSGGGSRPQDEKSMGSNLGVSSAYPGVNTGLSANHRPDGNPAADPLGAGPCNILFADGHVQTVDLQDFRPWIDKGGSKAQITFKLEN